MSPRQLFTPGRILVYCGLAAFAGLDACMAAAVNQAATPRPHTIAAGTVGRIAPLPAPSIVQYDQPIAVASATRAVGPAGGAVTAGHFTLAVPPGALTVAVPITITETSPLLEQCTIEPTGLHFGRPATLTMSYAGANADPASPRFESGGRLTALWFNPSVSAWTSIGGTHDPRERALSVYLGHLSAYALAR